ncbi:MAG: acetate--CoA ligase family protein, partial [Acidimicrobiia bacterium]|nr:acetate--CoA ligase family protein [Acidimicrobiia bacterium]
GNDLILSWEEDPSTDVIVMYLESFGNPRRFARIARRIARKKPIVAVKSGRTAAGTRAASSHTGALASTDTAVDALFRQTGVIRTTTIEELFDVASLLANQPLPKGRRVGVVTNAGGPGILAADAIESNGLVLPEFSPELQAKLREVLPAEAATTNPVDLIASAGPLAYGHVVKTLIESDEVDSVMGIHIPTDDSGGSAIGEAVLAAVEAAEGSADKTLLAVLMRSEELSQGLRTADFVIPAYEFPEAAATALARAVDYAEWRRTPFGSVPAFNDVDVDAARAAVASALDRLGDGGGWLEDQEVATVLGSFGIRLPKSATVTTPEEAVAAAAGIGTAVALKVVSPSALHKSDVGGVVLGALGEEQVRTGFAKVWSAVDDAEGVLVQEMIDGGHEVLIGMTEDPSFGPLIVFGMGGIYVELLGDVSFRVAPITDLEAASMVRGIKTSKLLDGYRGMPAGDLPATEEALLRISALIEAVPELVEMDLNPVKVLAPGDGVVVVDARIRVRPQAVGWSPELLDIPSVAGKA